MAHINPYLIFSGNCKEVFEFYKSAFGGEFASVLLYKEAPSQNPVSPGDAERIMHISLPIGMGTILMGSDQPESYGATIVGNNFNISIHPESEEEAHSLFDKLSAGGKVTMKLHKAFWGAYFGMFTDKFGIHWLVNYEYEQPL